jgi:RNA ligase
MITTLADLLDLDELSQMMAEGRITKQVHKDLPLSIYNYTAKAQYEGKWTNSERICRGLIVEDGTDVVIARGPEKFMNYGQPGAPVTDLDTLVRVTKKHDGSLGIGWKYGSDYGIATRGSFHSEQAQHATALIDNDIRYHIYKAGLDGTTPIYEIIYPENRIVLDYGNLDALLELGEVDINEGTILYRPREILHEIHNGRGYITLREALELPIPADEEGYVLDIGAKRIKMRDTWIETDGHVKLKGTEYKILHGLLTNTNARRIWVELAARDCHQWIETPDDWANKLGHNPDDFKYVKVDKDITETLLTNVPDEFYTWVTKQIDSINDKVLDLVAQSIVLAGQVSMVSDKRARFEMVKGHPMTKEILNHANSTNPEDISKIVLKAWKLAKPAGNETPFKTQEED